MHTTLNMPSCVCFDWDNTLIDSNTGVYNALCKVLAYYGHAPLTYDVFLALPPYSARQLWAHLLPDHPDAVEKMKDYYPVACETPMPGAADLLAWLSHRGIPMAVVSNKGGDRLRRAVQLMKWDHYFFAIVGSGDAAYDKPAPDLLNHALALHGTMTAGDHVWFVGDSVLDQECARRAGCAFVMVQAHCTNPLFPLFGSCADVLHCVKNIQATP
jgi:phosphoglycolate phosphatase